MVHMVFLLQVNLDKDILNPPSKGVKVACDDDDAVSGRSKRVKEPREISVMT